MKYPLISIIAVASLTACTAPSKQEQAQVHSCTPYQLKEGYCQHRAALDYTGVGQYDSLAYQPALNDYSNNPTQRYAK